MFTFSTIFSFCFICYVLFFSFKLAKILNPAYFLDVDVKLTNNILSPSWEPGKIIDIKVEILNGKETYVILSNIQYVFDQDVDKTRIILPVEIKDQYISDDSFVRFHFSDSLTTTSFHVDTRLVLYRSKLKRITKKDKKRYLIETNYLSWLIDRKDINNNEEENNNIPAYVRAKNGKIGYLLPRVRCQIISDWTNWPKSLLLPSHVSNHLRVDRRNNKYLPIVSTIQLNMKQMDMIQINTTNNHYPMLEIEISPISLTKWSFYAMMEEGFSMHRKLGIADENDFDEMRMLITGTPLELLLLTLFISLFHILFDILAFKSEIDFFRHLSTAEGVSLRSMGLTLIGQIIVTLYLMEEDASLLVLVPSYFGIFIGFWKMVRTFTLKKNQSNVNEQPMENKELEDVADSKAFSYMAKLLVPIVLVWSTYTLFKYPHTSWYAWIISTLASSVYAGGFALMTPQIFLNYKLKSVSHLDWSALWFRAFNTFIDDFFAYLIPMPGLARIAVFRDDIVFVIFLYQRYIYPVRKEKED